MLYQLKKDIPDSEELKSAEMLNKRGHDMFLDIIADSHNYLYKHSDDRKHLIYRVGHESSPRIFKSLDERCKCVDSVSNMKQCVHEFVLTQKFLPLHWGNIYIHRECLTRSQFIGDYKNPQFLYNDNQTECIMKSEDLGVLEDFQLKEIESTDISEEKISNTSLENNNNISSHLRSDVSVPCSQRQSYSHLNQKKLVLSHHEFMDVASKLSNSCRRNKKYGTAVSAMMIEMLDLCEGRQISRLNVSSEGNTDIEFSNMIQNYKSSFKSITDVSSKEKSGTSMPHKAVSYHLASSKRLIPSVEKRKKDIQKNSNQVTHPIAMPAPCGSRKKTIMFFL